VIPLAARCLATGERHRRRRGRAPRAAEEFVIYGQLPSYRAMLDREGFAGPEDAAIIGDENTVSDRLDELAKAGVDEFAAVTFDPSPGGPRAPARCCEPRTRNRPKFLWCGRSHKRTIERTTGSGETSPKCRHKR
jgi:alkanesulfonate monooxygenase SsuD/methylene tetrahydromethanopterin reductase-like flavin-dependent oxidoreductase (luciferase family)